MDHYIIYKEMNWLLTEKDLNEMYDNGGWVLVSATTVNMGPVDRPTMNVMYIFRLEN